DRLTEGAMRFRQCGVDADCCGRCFVGRRRTLSKRQHGETAKPVVVRSDARISDGVIWIEGDGLVIANDGLGKTIFGKSVPVETTTQVRFVSQRIIRAALRQALAFVAGQVRY